MDPQVLRLLQALVRAGIPLNQLLGNVPGVGSGLGAAGSGLGLLGAIQSGNVPGAIGSVAGLGANAANLAGYPGVAEGLGAVTGPLGLGTGIANGNPMQAIMGAAQTGSAVSGALGGPTIGAGLSSLTGLSGGALAVAAAPFVVTAMLGMSGDSEGLDMFGGEKTQAQKQIDEYKGYAEAFPDLVRRRVEGAGLFDDTFGTADEVGNALKQAASGIRATDLSPAYAHLAQKPYVGDKSKNAADIPGMDLSAWEAVAPMLEGQNWGSFIKLMDQGHGLGLDTGALAGGRNKTGAGYGTEGISLTDTLGDLGNYTGPTMRSSAGDERQATTQEAYDLSNSIAGIGQQLGIDWASRSTDGRAAGYEIAPDELGAYGFTPGNYGRSILSYLRGLDPSITEGPQWDAYTGALGVTDEELAGVPSRGAFRSKAPPPPMFNPYGLDLSGGGGGD